MTSGWTAPLIGTIRLLRAVDINDDRSQIGKPVDRGQFDGYFIEQGIHHNGKLVLGESIGDFAGAKIAFLAFKKAEQAKPQPTIDGYTPEQQFFISCGAATRFVLKRSAPWFRAILIRLEISSNRAALKPAGVQAGF